MALEALPAQRRPSLPPPPPPPPKSLSGGATSAPPLTPPGTRQPSCGAGASPSANGSRTEDEDEDEDEEEDAAEKEEEEKSEEELAPAVNLGRHVARAAEGEVPGHVGRPDNLTSGTPDVAPLPRFTTRCSGERLASVLALPDTLPLTNGGSDSSSATDGVLLFPASPALPVSDEDADPPPPAGMFHRPPETDALAPPPFEAGCGSGRKRSLLRRGSKRRYRGRSLPHDDVPMRTCGELDGGPPRSQAGTRAGAASCQDGDDIPSWIGTVSIKPALRTLHPRKVLRALGGAVKNDLLGRRPAQDVLESVPAKSADSDRLAPLAPPFSDRSSGPPRLESERQRAMTAPSLPCVAGDAGRSPRRIRSAQALVSAFGRALGVPRSKGAAHGADQHNGDGGGRWLPERRRTTDLGAVRDRKACDAEFGRGTELDRAQTSRRRRGNRHSAPNVLLDRSFSTSSARRWSGPEASGCASSVKPTVEGAASSTLSAAPRASEHHSSGSFDDGAAHNEGGRLNGDCCRRSNTGSRAPSFSRDRPMIQVNHEAQLGGSSFAQKKWWILEDWELGCAVHDEDAVVALGVAGPPDRKEAEAVAGEQQRRESGADFQERSPKLYRSTAGCEDAGESNCVRVDLSHLSASEIRRQEAIFELIATERDYVRDLKLIDKYYIQRIRRRELMDPRSIQVVFSNLESLIPLNDELLEAMEKRRREGNGVVKDLADIFLDMAQYLKMYTIYCSYHTRALEHLAELLEKRSPTGSPLHHSTRIGAGVTMSVPLNAKDRELAAELDSFLSATASMSCMRNLDLRAYLLLPVQRLCKYPLLLKEILKHTKSDDVVDGQADRAREHHHGTGAEWSRMHRAVEVVNSVVEAVNESSRQVDELRRTMTLWENIRIDVSLLPADSTRRILHHGSLLKAYLKDRHAAAAAAARGLSWRPRNPAARVPGPSEPGPLLAAAAKPGEFSAAVRHSRPSPVVRLSRRAAILFSDCLVLAKARSRGARIMFPAKSRDGVVNGGAKLVVRSVLLLEEYDVRDLEDTDELQNAFELYPMFRNTYLNGCAQGANAGAASPAYPAPAVLTLSDIPKPPSYPTGPSPPPPPVLSKDAAGARSVSTSSRRRAWNVDARTDARLTSARSASPSPSSSSSRTFAPSQSRPGTPPTTRRTTRSSAPVVVSALNAEEKAAWLSKIVPAVRAFRMQHR